MCIGMVETIGDYTTVCEQFLSKVDSYNLSRSKQLNFTVIKAFKISKADTLQLHVC